MYLKFSKSETENFNPVQQQRKGLKFKLTHSVPRQF